jgi:hypothetical protein
MSSKMLIAVSIFALTAACQETFTAPDASTPNAPNAPDTERAAIATYDLQSIAGQTLPITYHGGGNSWTITGARYRLFADGTYQFGYEYDGSQAWGPALQYIQRGSIIEFYLSQATAPQSTFYAGNHYLFSTGTVNGGAMSVKYTDPIDFEDEIYVLKQ